MTYQFKTYVDPFILPPKVGQSVPSKGAFNIIVFAPKFFIEVPQRQQIRFKMWGEDNHRYTTHSTPLRFQIKCNNTNFVTYLRDMKFLKIQTVDSRNSTVIGSAVINLMLYVNPEPMFNEWDCPFLPMREVFDLFKNNVAKSKIGEVEVEIECEFWKGPQDNKIRQIRTEERKQNTISPYNSDPILNIPSSMKSISFKKQYDGFNKTNEEQSRNNDQFNNTYQQRMPENQNIEYRPKTRPIPTFPSFEPLVNKYPILNVETQIAKLRLDANQFFTQTNTSQQLPANLNIRILKANTTSNEPLILFIEHPSKIGYKKVKTVITEVASINNNKGEIKYNKQLKIEDLKDVLDHYLRFIFKNQRKDVVGIGEIGIGELIETQEYRVSLINKTQKEIGKITIQSFNRGQKNKPKQVSESPLTNVVLKVPVSPKNNTPTKLNKGPSLMIILDVVKCSILTEQQDANIYYKVVFKFQKQTYQTKTLRKTHWNYSLITTINPEIPLETPFLMFEVWGCGADNRLLGVGKYETKALINLVNSGVMEVNLQSILLYDSSVQIQTINQQNIGPLFFKIRVGTTKQINRALQTPPLHIKAINQPQQPSSNPSSSPPTITDRQHLSSKQQSKSKLSSQHQPLDSRRSQAQQNSTTKNNIIQIHNLMQTITSFFSGISDTKQKIQLILKQMNLSGDMKLIQFEKVLQTVLDQYDQYWDAVSFFFGEGDHINTLQFLKSFSSFVNFKDILIEQLTALLQQLNTELTKNNLSLDVIQNKLSQYSQFGFISNQNIRQIFRIYKIDSFLIDRIIETYASTKQNQLIVSEFIHHLKCTKFSNPIQSLNYNLTNLQHLIQNSIIDVINAEAQSVNIITNTLSNRNMDAKSLCQLLETLQVDVSIWESLLLIESIKIFFKQDLDLVEGIISSKVMLSWLKSVISINLIPRPESVGHPTEPDLVVLRTERTETNPDDIANIASLLKEKDKLEYDDSSGQKRPVDDNYSQHIPSKILEESRPYGIPEIQQTERESKQFSYNPSLKRDSQSLKVSEVRPSNFKQLKSKLLQIKLDSDFDYLILDVTLLKSHQILIKKSQGVIKYCSSPSIYESLDINNISTYKSKTQGLSLTCKSFNKQTQIISKGLISLQDIFKIQSPLKKVCILYNNQMKIIGRALVQLSFIQKEQQSQVIQKQFLFLRVLKIQSSLNEKSQIDFILNSNTKIQNIELKKQYQIQLDYKVFKSKGQFKIISQNQKLISEFSIENLFTSKVVKLDLPLLRENCQYFGLIQVQISIKEEQEIMAKVEIQKSPRLSAFVFIDSLTFVGEQDRDLDVLFSMMSISGNSQQVYQRLELRKPLTMCSFSQIHTLDLINSSQPVTLKIVDSKSRLEIGKAEFKLFKKETEQISYIETMNLPISNRLNILMSVSMRAIVTERSDGIKLTNILETFKAQKIKRLIKKAQTIDSNNIRHLLRQQKVSLSQIQYFIQTLTKSGDLETLLSKIFKRIQSMKTIEQAISLLRQFQFYDIDKTGLILKENLNRILQNYETEKIQTFKKEDELISYLPYLKYESDDQNIEEEKIQHNIQKQYPPIVQKQQPKNQQTQQNQDQFKRICSQINKLHSILTKVRQQ